MACPHQLKCNKFKPILVKGQKVCKRYVSLRTCSIKIKRQLTQVKIAKQILFSDLPDDIKIKELERMLKSV